MEQKYSMVEKLNSCISSIKGLNLNTNLTIN